MKIVYTSVLGCILSDRPCVYVCHAFHIVQYPHSLFTEARIYKILHKFSVFFFFFPHKEYFGSFCVFINTSITFSCLADLTCAIVCPLLGLWANHIVYFLSKACVKHVLSRFLGCLFLPLCSSMYHFANHQ